MKLEISVILTTRNRAKLLPYVIDGLRKQTIDRTKFEVILIDDGSTDETLQLSCLKNPDIQIRSFYQRQSGLANAKNLGIFLAGAPIILFVDDDDVLAPNALEEHLKTHQQNQEENVAVLGHTKLAADIKDLPVMHHVTEIGCQLFSYKGLNPKSHYGFMEFWGGRTSCKRKFLINKGVFNPVFKFGYEDIELGWRLNYYGLKVIYNPRILTTMIRSLNFREFCKRSVLQGLSLYKFAQIHGHTDVQKYCNIDNNLNIWRDNWKNYALNIRRSEQIENQYLNLNCFNKKNERENVFSQLNTFYKNSFMLSVAKGVSDAKWLSTLFSVGDEAERKILKNIVYDIKNYKDKIKKYS